MTETDEEKGSKKVIPKRWRPKEYSITIQKRVNHNLKENEKVLYNTLINDLIETNNLTTAQDIMLVHTSVFDFMRILRVQNIILQEGDIVDVYTKSGQKIRRAHEASYLLNSIETQLRQNFKELMLTKKEQTKKIIAGEQKDITKFMEVEAQIVQDEQKETKKA